MKKSSNSLGCVVYLHGNSGSRINSLELINWLLPLGLCLISFDFLGCGLSDGEFISLGIKETDQTLKVLRYFQERAPFINTFCLWGRSMGAVVALQTTIKLTSNDIPISCLVLDSPFSNLKHLCKELFIRHSKLPGFLFNMLWRIVRKRIQTLSQIDLDILDIKPSASACSIPAIYCSGFKDTFVSSEHSRLLYSLHKAEDKLLVNFDGDHNSRRPVELLESLINFLVYRMFKSSDQQHTAKLYGKIKKDCDENKPSTEKLAKSMTPSLLSFFDTEAMDLFLDKAFQDIDLNDLKEDSDLCDAVQSSGVHQESSLPSPPRSFDEFQKTKSYFESERTIYHHQMKLLNFFGK
jgi:pimeloyl-ACP methyl ester carboxylesterase